MWGLVVEWGDGQIAGAHCPPPSLGESVKLQVQWKTLSQNKVMVIDEDIEHTFLAYTRTQMHAYMHTHINVLHTQNRK